MLKLFKHLKKTDYLMIIASIIFVVVQVWLDLKIPDYMGDITQLLKLESGIVGEIWLIGGKMLLCALGSAGFAVLVGFFTAKIAAGLSKKLREDVYNKVQNFSLNEIKKFSTASLITRSTNDVMQIQMFVAMSLQLMIKAPITAIWAICKILGKSWQLSITTFVFVAVLVISIITIMLIVIPKFKKMQTLTDNLNRTARENLTGIRVVRAYNAEDFEAEKFGKANKDLTKNNLFAHRVMSFMAPLMTLISSGLTLAIYWIGAILINSAQAFDKIVMFSDVLIFSSYAMQVVMSFAMLTIIFIMLPRAAVSAKRINEVLETENSLVNGNMDGEENVFGEIEFNNVSFKYPNADEYILKDFNLKINKGEVVAFIGSTGSGKSTLINLVVRFYDVTEGEIKVDGVNVKDYDLHNLYNKIGYVSQKSVLFKGTVNSNIAFGESKSGKPTEEEIVNASKIAQSHEFVSKMSDGYDSEITQNGTNVSGGQKQRISIARAIARKPEIIIFDDSFSALDFKTDKVLRSEISKKLKGTTCLIVAQRIGTIKNADKIVVLNDGNVVGIGKHKELMKNCEVYKEIAYSQLSKKELENE